MKFDFKQPRNIDCGCGHLLFEVAPGVFDFYAGTIECSRCRSVSQVIDLLLRVTDGATNE